MSVLKRKSSVALIIGIIVILLLIPLWYMMLVPSIIASEMEKIDITTSFEGTFAGRACVTYYGVLELPIRIQAHAYVENVRGDNIIVRVDTAIMNITDPDKPNKLEELSYNSTYVINKFTQENVPNAIDADKNRTGYDLLYPSHLKADENITNVWLDMLNTTATLEFVESREEEGLTLYKYFANETIIKEMDMEGFKPGTNFTLMYTKTILIEPLSGVLAYTENETFRLWFTPKPPNPPTSELQQIVYPLTYRSTDEAKTQGIADAKTMHDGMQLLELYIPTILGVVVILLVIGLAFNVRRLERKMTPT